MVANKQQHSSTSTTTLASTIQTQTPLPQASHQSSATTTAGKRNSNLLQTGKRAHFGARLKPLNQHSNGQQQAEAQDGRLAGERQSQFAGSAAASAPSPVAYSSASGQRASSGHRRAAGREPEGAGPLDSRATARSAQLEVRPTQPASRGVSAGRSPQDVDEDEDDEVDGESLLYNMMQQQNFLLNAANMQRPDDFIANHNGRSSSGNTGGSRQTGGSLSMAGPQASSSAAHGGAGSDQRSSPRSEAELNLERDLANSKKVIKLLKSYSHIHQVDDSDDQIRGTHMRMSSAFQRPQQASR